VLPAQSGDGSEPYANEAGAIEIGGSGEVVEFVADCIGNADL
jgi:hypothetical protein